LSADGVLNSQIIQAENGDVIKQSFGCNQAATAICSELRTSGRLLDNSARFLLGLTENETTLLLTVSENQLTIDEKNLQTSGSAHVH
jgi:hypothetical protein